VISVESAQEARSAIPQARESRQSIVSRGSGYSYGDPALNRNQIVLHVRPMHRVLNWDPETGTVDVEPGVTVGDLCRHVAGDGWWPAVVPGAQGPTLGGCVAANVHGKNNWRMGPIGEHVEEIEMLLADGSSMTCGPDVEPEVFRAAVGGFGLLGVLTRIRLRMVRNQNLAHVEHYAAPRLADLIAILERWAGRADAMVAWIDAMADAGDLGRGLVQIADFMPADDRAGKTVTDVLPTPVRSRLWMLMRPLTDPRAMRALNAAQFGWGWINNGRTMFVPRRRFEFFHDAVPGWNQAFSSGIVQYQMFVPRDAAPGVFREVLEQARARGCPPFLAVMKLHCPDAFLLSEGVDGFSLSLDFAPGRHGYDDLAALLRRFTDEHVLPAGGRFYLAKDSIMTSSQARHSFGEAAVDEFLELKRRLDPEEVFQSDMYRRLLKG
jgi:FAD/FMN-containing dehydrogenase